MISSVHSQPFQGHAWLETLNVYDRVSIITFSFQASEIRSTRTIKSIWYGLTTRAQHMASHDIASYTAKTTWLK